MPRLLRALALAALLLVLCPSAVQAQTLLWVVDEAAPLRSGPSAQAEVLARLPRGAAVRLLDAEGAWLRVREAFMHDGGGRGGRREGYIYQGHLAASPPPQAPALASLFAPLPESLILAEAADTSRSSRSQAPAKSGTDETLWTVLDMRLTLELLEEFLQAGGIGEYAQALPSRPGAPQFPALRSAAPYGRGTGGEAERQVGLNLAAAVVRRMAKPAFGMALQRYVNLVGLAVARYAPGQLLPLRVVVLDLPAPVSFSLPGGVVMVSTGLVSALENEAQLALILAHEAAHASLSHVWVRALASQFFRKGGMVDTDGVRSYQFRAMIEDLLVSTLSLGIDPGQEFEADAAAVQMAWRAGYDPQQYPRALALIEAAAQVHARREPPLAWPALHPPTAERLARLSPLLARLPQYGLALATERFRASR